MNKYALRFFVPDSRAYALACALDLPIKVSDASELFGHFSVLFETAADRQAFRAIVEESYEG